MDVPLFDHLYYTRTIVATILGHSIGELIENCNDIIIKFTCAVANSKVTQEIGLTPKQMKYFQFEVIINVLVMLFLLH